MPVGNDVVDLEDPENQPEALHPRWDLRVFTPEERNHLHDALRPHHERWAMWAAKESAYKAAAKVNSGVPFFPNRFRVDFRSPAEAWVRHELGPFNVRLSRTEQWVHAVAVWRPGAPYHSEVETLPQPDHLPSWRARRLARRMIQTRLHVHHVTIRTPAGQRAPAVWANDVRLPIDLSLAHHGRFVACAWQWDRR